jgi:hypothetical protein
MALPRSPAMSHDDLEFDTRCDTNYVNFEGS